MTRETLLHILQNLEGVQQEPQEQQEHTVSENYLLTLHAGSLGKGIVLTRVNRIKTYLSFLFAYVEGEKAIHALPYEAIEAVTTKHQENHHGHRTGFI